MPDYTDAVVMLPGFLGFEQIGGLRYFADRAAAALRGALDALSNRPIPVIPAPTLPTAALAQRQAELLRTLRRVDQTLGGLQRLHLVGHSTGGVDAALLTHAQPVLSNRSWESLDLAHTREKIATVVTISAPHYGTCLADSPLARFARYPWRYAGHVGVFGKALAALLLSASADALAPGALGAALLHSGQTARYFYDVLRARQLIDDLRPAFLAPLQLEATREHLARLFTVVTLTAESTASYLDPSGRVGLREPDRFFRVLYEQTAGPHVTHDPAHLAPVEAAVAQIAARLYDDQTTVIRNRHALLHPVSAELNDGIVNSARQLIDPADPDELLALVVADHIDVLGYYPQWRTTTGAVELEGGAPGKLGLLHSGSGFGDDEFFRLYTVIARAILAVRDAGPRLQPLRRSAEQPLAEPL